MSEEKCSDEAAKKEVGGGRVSRGRSGGRKYFRRSRASVQVDDPIEEEDEEAVEAEKIEVVFSPPPFEVRSILKQRKQEEEEEEMGATASTAAIDAATLSPELFLGETRERREPKPKAKAKKTVAFADAPVVVAESPGGGGAFSPLSLTSSPSASSSDDEWTGYDKVVVSHNLAEEILDEIYGKLEDNKEEKESGGLECDAATSVIYEDVAAVALDTKALAEAAAAEAAKKKTMADEILDELYGVSATAAAASKSPATASPSRSPKSGRSRDDSLLPDNTGSASALMMGKFTASG